MSTTDAPQHLPLAGAPPAAAPTPTPQRATGPLRNGNPRGDPNLAPRCGAKNRAGNPCRAPAMANGRCRLHGGKCTGPRTAEGKAAFIATHTKHGRYAAGQRASKLYARTLVVRTRLIGEANRLSADLPPEMAARLAQCPDELWPPVHLSNQPYVTNPESAWLSAKSRPTAARPNAAPTPHGLAAERLAARAEKAALAPWRQAIAAARAARRAARAAKREAKAARQQARAARIAARPTHPAARAPAADGRTRAAHPNVASSPPAPLPGPIAPYTGDSLLERELAARAAGLRATVNRPPSRASTPAPAAAFKPFRIDPLNREPAAKRGSTAPFKPSGIDPLNREPTAKPGSTAPFKPSRIDPLNREPTVPPGSAHLALTRAAALRSTTLAATWEPTPVSQFAARFGRPAPVPGWRIPQAMPETGPVAAALSGFLAAPQTREM